MRKMTGGSCHGDRVAGRGLVLPLVVAVLAVLAGLPAAAQAEPAVSATVALASPAQPVAAGANVTYSVGYNFSTGRYRDIAIVVDLPDSAWYLTSTFPTGTTFQTNCGAVGPVAPPGTSSWKWRCTFTLGELDLSAGGLSGEIVITAATRTFAIIDGSEKSTVAELNGFYEASPGSYSPLTPKTVGVTTRFAAKAQVVLNDQSADVAFVSSKWEKMSSDGEAGISFNYTFFSQNRGNGPIAANSEFAVTLPDFVEYLGFSLVTSWQILGETWTVDSEADHVIRVRNQAAFGSTPTVGQVWDRTSFVSVRAWVPCSQMGRPAVDYDALLSFSGVEPTATGTVAWSLSKSLNADDSLFSAACGTGASGQKQQVGSRTAGRYGKWQIDLWPPRGIFPIVTPLLIDYVSPLTTVGATTQPAGFTRYYCVVPGVSGNFSREDFLGEPGHFNYKADHCWTTLPADPSTVTHVVWEADQWGTNSEITKLRFTMCHINDADLADGTVVSNVASFSAGYWEEGWDSPPEPSLSFKVDNSIMFGFLTDSGYQRINGSALPTDLVFAGQFINYKATVRSDWSGAMPQNPTFELVIAEGLEILEEPTLGFLCYPPAAGDVAGPVMTVEPDGRRVYRWTVANWTIPYGCNISCISRGWQTSVYALAKLRVRDDYFFLDGQELISSFRVYSEGVTNPWILNDSVFTQSPDEMRIDIEPGCNVGEDKPVFNITFENTGGGTLTNVTLYFELPRNGVEGSNVDAVFDSAFVTLPGAVLAYSMEMGVADPMNVTGWSEVLPADPGQVTWVRASIARLDPLTGENLFAVVFTPGIDPESIYVARAKATMDSTELSPVTTGLSVPFGLNGCPRRVIGTVFFDIDADGVIDTGEPLLPDWTVNLHQGPDVSGELLSSTRTDLAGMVDVWLSIGTYTMAVVLPDGSTLLVDHSPATFLVAQEPASVLFPVTCACESDDNPCTDEQCHPDLSCVSVPDDTNACRIDVLGVCMGTPSCQNGQCTAVPLDAGTDCGDCAVCDSTGGCSVIPDDDSDCGQIDCDDLDTVCLDYHDVTGGGCVALFECPSASEACTEFTQALPLNVAQDYNVFVFTHYTAVMDVLGSIAAGTDIEGSGFDISRMDPDGWAIVAGGDVTLTNGSIWGDIWVAGEPKLTNVDLQGSTFNAITTQAPIDFVAAQAALTDLSVQLSGVSANGSTSEGPQVVFTGNSAVNVFAVTSDQLETATDLVFDIPEGTTSIVNIRGTDITMKQFEVFGVVDPTRILFNASEAWTINVTAVEIVGSLLAPGATVVFEAGDWEGTIVANALEGYGEVHYFPFAGELPCDALTENLNDPLGAGDAAKTPFMPTLASGCAANPSVPGTASGWGLALLGMALGILMLRRRVRS